MEEDRRVKTDSCRESFNFMKQDRFMVAIGTFVLGLAVNDISSAVQQKPSLIRVAPYITLITVGILWSLYKQVTFARQPYSPETLFLDPESLELVALEQVQDKILKKMNGLDCIRLCEFSYDNHAVPAGEARIRKRKGILEGILYLHGTRDVTDLRKKYQPDTTLRSSTVLRKRFEIDPQAGNDEMDKVVLKIVDSMRLAYSVDKDCTLQLGASAIFKFTDTGLLKRWKLHERWTPTISSISRLPFSLLECLTGKCTKWTIRGFNLQEATLKVATGERTEKMKILHQHQMNNGVDVLVCEEPRMIQALTPRFEDNVYICASKSQEVEDGVTVILQSEAKNVKRAYWVSVVDGLIPGPFTVTMTACLSFLTGLGHVIFGRHYLRPTLLSRYLDVQSGQASTLAVSVLPTTWSDLWSHVWGHAWIQLELFRKIYLVYLFINICVSVLWPLLRRYVLPIGVPTMTAGPSTASLANPRPGITEVADKTISVKPLSAGLPRIADTSTTGTTNPPPELTEISDQESSVEPLPAKKEKRKRKKPLPAGLSMTIAGPSKIVDVASWVRCPYCNSTDCSGHAYE